jgi:predicted nuclease with TOPRIM domain
MAQSSDNSAAAGLIASTAGPNELERKIAETEQELREVKQDIKELNKRLNADIFTPDQHYPSVEKVQSKIERLENEKVALQNEKVALQNEKVELLREKNIHLEQQQQTGAGTSMCASKISIRRLENLYIVYAEPSRLIGVFC